MWDIFRRGEDTVLLSHWLGDNAAMFVHKGQQVEAVFSSADCDALGPLRSHQFMLCAGQRQQLKAATGGSVRAAHTGKGES